MGHTHTEHLGVEHIPLLQALDEQIFPEEMLLSVHEYERLTSIAGGILVTYVHENLTLGAAFAIKATAMQEELREQDGHFTAHERELYSYSEAVLPMYQRQGIGTALLCALAQAARDEGYTFLSAHVRAHEDWVHKRKEILKIKTTRVVPLFWNDPKEPVEYQLALLG